MPTRTRSDNGHALVKVVVYGLAGLVLLLLFLEVWPTVAGLRYPLLIAFVVIMLGWHSYAWRRQREDRKERQRRWGLRR